MPKPRRMILDVDTGIDDAMAILFAVTRPGLRLEAVTTTYGNIDVASATRNSRQILDLAGRSDIPVAAGAARSFTRPYKGFPNIHGANGLGEVELPPPSRPPVAEHACDLIIGLVRENPGEIVLCAVGPLTNTALALAKAPEIGALLQELVIMGGTIFHPGIPSVPSPMADANIYSDPEAARLVFQSGARITMVGMDVTMQTLLTPAMMEEIAAGTPAARTMMHITDFYYRAYKAQYPDIEGCGLHDPLAVAIVEDPTLATTEPMQIDVELAGELTRGQVVADRRRTGTLKPNVDVCLGVDVPRFTGRLVETLKRAGA